MHRFGSLEWAQLLVILLFSLPCRGQTSASSWNLPSQEFLLSLGAVSFLTLLFGLLIWNRNQQMRAQRRTQELLDRLDESNAQTRDLQTEVKERRHTEAVLMKLSNLKRLIAGMSAEFVRLGPGDMEEGLQSALSRIAEFINVSRAYIYLARPDGQTLDCAYEWCAQNVLSLKAGHQGLNLSRQLPWFASRIRDFHLIRLQAGEELTEEISRERHLLGQDYKTTTVIFPMASGNRLRGFMGIDIYGGHTEISEDVIDLLKVVGEIFTHALDRERSEKILRESEERFRELTDLLPIAIFEMDLNTRITYINRQGLSATGYGSGLPVGGLQGLSLFAESDRPQLERLLKKLLATGEEINAQEFCCMPRDGSAFPAMVYARLITQDAKPAGYRCILVDMTRHKHEQDERRRHETQFLQAQKFESLSVMAGSIAHNFNNLLTVVLGNLELVLADSPEEAPWMAHLVEADRAVKRAAELSSMMLTYVGKSRFNLVNEDLSHLVRDLYGILHASLSRKIGLELRTEPACTFKGDPVHIRQVIVNLFNNAAEAIGEQSGKILLTTGITHYTPDQESVPFSGTLVEGDYVFLEVSDDGSGMDEATRVRVFDPFFTTKFTGRGMGLAAVLGIVRAHNGGIALHSETGKGTKVRVLFPHVVAPSEESAEPAKPNRLFNGSGLVLLVDDEAMILSVGERMLRRLGFDVVTAADGVEALEVFKARTDEIRCVLLDLSMPRMDGEEAFRALIEMRPGLLVILASGYSRDQIANRFQDLHPAGFIRKPYQLKDLSRVLEATLGD